MANINAYNERGDTALLAYISRFDVEAIRLLLRQGADPNLPSRDGKLIPLHLATHNTQQHNTVAAWNVFTTIMAAENLDVNQRDLNGDTALMYALKQENKQASLELLKNPAVDVNIENEQGETAIFHSLFDQEVLQQVLFVKHANINHVDNENISVVEQLFVDPRIFVGNFKAEMTIHLFALLLNVPNQRLTIMPDALHAIIVSEDVYPKVLSSLLKSDLADIDFSVSSLSDGLDPICYAARMGNIKAMITLVNHTDYDITNGKLAFASISDEDTSEETIKYLIQQGINFDIVDEFGNPPLTYAIKRENLDAAILLLEKQVGLNPGNQQAHDMLMFEIVKTQSMPFIKAVYNSTDFNLAKAIVIAPGGPSRSPLEHLIHIPNQGNIDKEFIREYLDFTAPIYGFIGFFSPLPHWFKASHELSLRYQKYDALAYKCIANTDKFEFKDICSKFNLPYGSQHI